MKSLKEKLGPDFVLLWVGDQHKRYLWHHWEFHCSKAGPRDLGIIWEEIISQLCHIRRAYSIYFIPEKLWESHDERLKQERLNTWNQKHLQSKNGVIIELHQRTQVCYAMLSSPYNHAQIHCDPTR